MRSKIKKLIDAANVIDRAYDVKSRAMAVKPNIIVLFYAIANSDNLSQSQLHNEWLLPLTTINTITTECRNAGYITLEPIPGKRRECYNIFTANHRYNSNESRNILPKNDAMTLKYVPAKGMFDFVILDWKGKRFAKSAKCELKTGVWHHVAVQWDPSGAAELFVGGRRIFSLPLEGFVPWSLKDNREVAPNARIPLEFYVGANYSLGRIAKGDLGETPFFVGALDGTKFYDR